MKCTKTCLTIHVYLQNMYWMDYLGIDTDHDSGEAREKKHRETLHKMHSVTNSCVSL